MFLKAFIFLIGLNLAVFAAPSISPVKENKLNEELSELCHDKPADIIFALDSSTSIHLKDFRKQLLFVQNVINAFDMSPDKTRVGVVSFSNWAFLDFHLNRFTNKQQVLDGVNKITHVGGDTNTAGALRYVRDYMFTPERGSRPGIPHIIIVLTDGKSNFPKDTQYEAFKSKRSGFSLFAVGVGPAIDQDELIAIASQGEDNEYVFQVDNYSALESIKEIIAIGACAVPEPVVERHQLLQDNNNTRACQGNITDIVFNVSPSSTHYGTSAGLDFFHDIIEHFDMINGNLQFGILPKECLDYPKIELENQISKNQLLKQIDKMLNSDSSLSHHIEYFMKHSFSESEGSRSDSRKVAVLIVEEEDLSDFKKTLKKAQVFKKAGGEILVVGIGKDLPLKKLAKISSNGKKNVFSVVSYDELLDISSTIQDIICPLEK